MAKQATATVSTHINMIGEGTVFEGNLSADGDIRISGRIVGKLDTKGKAIVAQEGSIEGEVRAMNLDVAGHIHGEMDVEERVILKSSARIDGNIRTARLVVEEGASFNGQCQMGGRTFSGDSIASDRSSADVPEIRAGSGQGNGF